MPDCPHDQFESLVTVRPVEPPGLPPCHQVRLQVRCTQCGGAFIFAVMNPVTPTIALPVAVGAGGTEVYLSGTVMPPPPAQGSQAWTRVVMPETEPAPQ